MIYTVTFNPSLDHVVTVNNFTVGGINRTATESIFPGGKGINVSTVLNNLGVPSTALGFVAGFTGDEVVNSLNVLGVHNEFIKLDFGLTRINMKLANVDGTEINGPGPDIPAEKTEELMHRLDSLAAGDVLVLAGSIPSSVSDDIYEKIMRRLSATGVRIVVDATGKLLTNVLPLEPFLVKPNNFELGDIFGVSLNTRNDVIPYAIKLQKAGARNVLVSMGAEGAVLVAEDGDIYEAEAPSGETMNCCGAGDSMVAGFIAGWLEKNDYCDAFRMGLAAGSATAFSENLATGDDIREVLKRVSIRKA